jgi:hypothetical protein
MSNHTFYFAREAVLLLFFGAFLGLLFAAMIANYTSAPGWIAAISAPIPYAAVVIFRIAYRRRTGRGFLQEWAEAEGRRESREKARKGQIDNARAVKVGAPSVLVAYLWCFAAIGLAIYACALIGSQSLYWLKTGEWLPLPIGALFMPRFDDMPWPIALVPDLANEKILRYVMQESPSRWVGLQKIVSWLVLHVPLSLASYALSFVAFGAMSALSDARERSARLSR